MEFLHSGVDNPRLLGLIVIAIQFIILTCLLIRLMFLKFKNKGENKYWSDLPSELPPFAVGHLMSSSERFADYMASEIAYFIDKGLIRPSKVNDKLSLQIIRNPSEDDGLWEYQNLIFKNFIQGKVDVNGIVTLDSFKNNSRNLLLPLFVIASSLMSDLTERGYVKEDVVKTVKDKVIFGTVICTVFLFMIFVPTFFNLGFGAFDITFIGVVFLTIIIHKVAIIDYTCYLSTKGKIEYKQWLSFKSFLNNYAKFEDRGVVDVVIWKKFLVYASALDVDNKLTDEVNDFMTTEVLREIRSIFLCVAKNIGKQIGKQMMKDVLNN